MATWVGRQHDRVVPAPPNVAIRSAWQLVGRRVKNVGQESNQVNQQQALALVQAFRTSKDIIIPAGMGPPPLRGLDTGGQRQSLAGDIEPRTGSSVKT